MYPSTLFESRICIFIWQVLLDKGFIGFWNLGMPIAISNAVLEIATTKTGVKHDRPGILSATRTTTQHCLHRQKVRKTMSDNKRFLFTIMTIALCVFGSKRVLKRLETPLEKVLTNVVLDYDTVAAWRFMGI